MLIYRDQGNAALEQMPFSAAPQLPPEQVGLEAQLPQIEALPPRQKAKVMVRIFLIALLAFVMVARFAVVSQANLKMLDAKTAIKSQQMVNGDMESKLTNAADFSTMQEKAALLQMDFPENEQIKHINVASYEDIVAEHEQKEKEKRETGVVWQMKE